MNLPGIGYSARLKYLLLCESSVVMYDNQMDEFWYHLLEVCPHSTAPTLPPLNLHRP